MLHGREAMRGSKIIFLCLVAAYSTEAASIGKIAWGRHVTGGSAAAEKNEHENGEFTSRLMRLRGGVMWVGGGRQFNRTADPTASPESVEDTFHPLRERLTSANRIKALQRKFGEKYRTNEVISLEEESKYLIRAQKLCRVKSLSMDLTAATAFQKHVVGDLDLAQQRVGIMYGKIEKDGSVCCEAIYEPPQEGNDDSYKLLEDPDASTVDRVAALLGLRKVGWVFSARTRKCILSGEDIQMSCKMQKQLEDTHGYDFARSWVSAVIMHNETTGSISFEAFHTSDLCMDMFRRGILKEPSNSNKGYSRTTENVLVERKDAQKVDTDFFLLNVPIKTHKSSLFSDREADFPIENRVSQVQNGFELKHVLKCHESLPFAKRLRDFHLLVFLAKTLDPVSDMPSLCQAVIKGDKVSDGHKVVIETLSQQK